MTRLYRTGVTVERASSGLPKAFTWRGSRRTITAILGQWRLCDYWWERPTADVDVPSASARDYFRVRCKDGLLCELYFDDEMQGWVLDRVLD
jgi:hypothetical protein